MSLNQDAYQLEYVTGGIQLPAWGTSPMEVIVNISVLNAGATPEVTRVFGLRGLGHSGIGAVDQMFDSDLDFDPLGSVGPSTGDVAPGEEWSYTWNLVGYGTSKGSQYYKYWFRILATSPNLIPSAELVSQDAIDRVPFLLNWSVVARYVAGDFTVIHRQFNGVEVPEGEFHP